MPKIVMYTTGFCPYCLAAKSLLAGKGISYEEIRVDQDPGKRSEMTQKSQRSTVPQIFVGDIHIGGFDDLAGLHRAGKLDVLLSDD